MKVIFQRETDFRKLRAVLISAAVLLVAGSGLLYTLDRQFGDWLYERESSPDERIFVIGIDTYAMEQIGAWPWDRAVMAEILETLNADPGSRPAAIGLDVVYAGETSEESDRRLVEAASAGNVAVACTVNFENSLILEADGSAYMDAFVSTGASMPFETLTAEVRTGHINAMYDKDGVLRRHLWSVETAEGETLYSLPEVLVDLYCEANGMDTDYKPRTDQRGFWWVDFSAQPGDYYYCSAADILDGAYDPDMLEGAIVLIGPYEASMSDDFVTPADRAKRMYGVEYMANVTANILQQNEKTELPHELQLMLLFAACMGCAMIFREMKMRWIFVVYAGILILCTAGFYGFYRQGYIMHPLWFLAGLSILFLSSLVEQYTLAVRERHHVRKTFERYVDPAIIRELLKDDEASQALTGRTKNIAVLFVDIRGFTTMSEELPPEEVVQILNEYLTLTSRCVKKRKGTLDKFIGDCTMAFWGAPLKCMDPIYQACKAAMDMVEGARPLEEKLLKRFGRAVSFGVGVHYGPAVVGNIGAPDRMDYTAIGDTVNTASRLESKAPPGTIYISRIVADMLGERAVTESLEKKLLLKGKTEGMEVLILKELK
ncbi:MAG: adenylate/guanylate cyclase domain-containing protein [Clostridiales bacterium]|nr:adenylate/guanylate cyclase domain-containing protein [Clostridiales bacterium]